MIVIFRHQEFLLGCLTCIIILKVKYNATPVKPDMKRILFIALVFFACIMAFGQEQKIISDCTITFSIKNSGAGQQKNLGSKIIYIKGKDIRIDLISNNFNQTIFYNSNSGNATVLKNIGESKYISQYSANDWEKVNDLYNGVTISLTGNTKTILNYLCRSAVVKLKSGDAYTIYYTPDLMPSVTENAFEIKNVPGLILEYESPVKEKEKIIYTANKIDFSPVPSLQFEIPKKGYRILH
jgi:GLPGLI family protein